MDPLGSGDVRGLVARNRHGVSRIGGLPRQQRLSANLDRGYHRVEELVEASMVCCGNYIERRKRNDNVR